jgi:glycosyltransferase involved in cell wall biosynthesis
MLKPQLSLCMIVRNEESVLKPCLASVKSYVDEIIIVDTGSTDQTVAIAQEFGARVFHHTWSGDFSAARNHSIAQAQGDWILVLDADEQLAPRDAQRIPQLIKNSKVYGYYLIQRTYLWDGNYVISIPNPRDYEVGTEYTNCVQVPVIRLFRNDARIHYYGRVHELVEQSFKDHPLPAEPSDIVLHHFGKVLDPAHLEAKKRLYLELGKKKAAEESANAMAQYEIGVQLYEFQQFEEAIPHFLKAYELNNKADVCLLYAAKAYHVLGNMTEAEKHYRQCVDLAPGARVFFEYANFERDLGHLKTAISLYQKSLAFDPGYALSIFNLGGVYIRMGQIQSGFGYIKKAIKLEPNNETFHENFGRLTLAGGPAEEAVQCLEDSPKARAALQH